MNNNENDDSESDWIDRIQKGDGEAWQALIDQYEGRLLAYAFRRLGDRTAAEDIVQETLVGFLTSLPNYDRRRRLENYLFSICGYKLTDHLRKSGRRPTLPLLGSSTAGEDGPGDPGIPASARGASSIVRSVERRQIEETAIASAIEDQIERWRSTDNWSKLQAIELLFVVGRSNSEVAEMLKLSQQQVANLKSDFLIRLKAIIRRENLDADVFPELATEE
ncbi:MAG: sigma-70 family RNA polymerase sigma factor [Planctomycetota bacterium]